MSVPGQDLAVSREPQKVRERYARPTLKSALRDAFKAAERQLLAYKDQLREETTPPNASALAGQVTLIEPGTDHGFILTSTGSQLYFHRDSVTNGRFKDLRQGDLVHYVEEEGDTGPVATKIRVC
jgi:cold shock CspA family protein